MGKMFLKVALVLQIVVLIGFVALMGYFHYQCKKHGPFPKNVRGVLITLYCSSVLIGIRAIYRTVEYYTVTTFRYTPTMSSSASPLIRDEAFFWVFEALLMLANSFLLNFRHPMRFLPKDSKIYLEEDGITETVGEGYQDVRFFLIAMVDPFDLIGLAMGRHMRREFWKTSATSEPHGGSTTAVGDSARGRDNDVEKAVGAKTDEAEAGNEENAAKAVVRMGAANVNIAGPENEEDKKEVVVGNARGASSSNASQAIADLGTAES
jgi:hypothetical protein